MKTKLSSLSSPPLTQKRGLSLLVAVALFAGSHAAMADVVPVKTTPPAGALLGTATRSLFELGNADLGIVWDNGQGELQVAFGDSSEYPSFGGGPGASGITAGTAGAITQLNPAAGLTLASMVRSDAGAEAIIAGCPTYSTPGFPHCIPTGAATIDGVDFIQFMNVESQACEGGGYQTHGSGLAWRMAGENTPFAIVPVTSMTNMDWGPRSNFGQVALLSQGNYMYMFGTPPGRAGAVQLARAPGSMGVYYGNWTFWDGTTWQANQRNAAYIVPAIDADASVSVSGAPAWGSVAELSVEFDPGLGRYLMTYLDMSRNTGSAASSPTGAIVLRDAPNLEGPWTDEKQILNAAEVPGLYGGYMYPETVSGRSFGSSAGTDLYFNVSEWGPYDVFPYHSILALEAAPDNLITDGSFEEQFSGLGTACPKTGVVTAVYPPWSSTRDPAVGFDSCLGNAATGGGNNEAWINASDATSAWHDIHQSVAVQPNTSYVLTFMVNTFNVGTGLAGIRTRGAPVAANGVDMCGGVKAAGDSHTTLSETTFTGTTNGYQQVSVTVNPGARSLVDVFIGFESKGGGADSWARIDLVSLVPKQHVNDNSFEMQSSTAIGWPYGTEGTGAKGIDQGAGFSHTGLNDGWINTSNVNEWNAITQVVSVTPGQTYTVSGWVQTSSPFRVGFLGVRNSAGVVKGQNSFGPEGSYTFISNTFVSDTPTVTLFAGYWTPTTAMDTWMRVDDLSIE